MQKLFATNVLGASLVVMASAATVLAQPAPPPAPQPKPDVNVGDKTDNLQHNQGSERPWAKGVSQDEQRTAVRLFGEGNQALNDGLFPKAVETYADALRHWDHPAIHYNMALALTKLDRPIEVEHHLTKAIAYGPDPLETSDKFEHAKEYLVLNSKLLAWIDVTCSKVGARVLVDNKEVFVVEAGKENRYRGRVTVGRHSIFAQKTGYETQVDAPYIEPGQTFQIELTLFTADELTRYKRRWRATWMPLAVIGGGVVVAGVAALIENSAQSSYDRYDAEIARCNADATPGTGCAITKNLTDIKGSGDTKRTLGYVGYGVALGAVAAGGVLLFLNREIRYEISGDEYRKELRKKAAVSVVPMVAPNHAGALIEGRF